MVKNNTRVTFDFPGETTLIDVVRDILEKNNLKEDDQDFSSKIDQHKEPLIIIIKNAAVVMMQKRVSEKKLSEFLAKHLETSQEVAEKIIKDVNEKLIPFAKIIDLDEQKREAEMKKEEEKLAQEQENSADEAEEQKKEAFSKAKEELLKKIGVNESVPEPELEEIPAPYKKSPDITDVEKNAENMEREGKNITRKERESTPAELPAQPKKPDAYQEPIE